MKGSHKNVYINAILTVIKFAKFKFNKRLCNINQQMQTFQINALIQFLASPTRFEHSVLVVRKTVCTCSFVWYVFHTFA